MDPAAIPSALARFGRVRERELLSRHTTLRLGGPARWFLEVDHADQVPALHAFLTERGLPWTVLGGGSNIVAADEGYEGVVICPRHSKYEIRPDGLATAEAGVITALFARKVTEAGYTGWEWGIGLPGTIGGAVVGNAGCFGGETRDGLVWVEGWSMQDAAVKRYEAQACGFGYRDSRFKREPFLVLRAAWQLSPATDPLASQARLKDILAQRKAHQPLGSASAGCLFKNLDVDELTRARIETRFGPIPMQSGAPNRIPAGWLIERAGLKGFACGQAHVSERHANFAVCQAGATSRDLRTLSEEVRERVAALTGLALEPEVRFLGGRP